MGRPVGEVYAEFAGRYGCKTDPGPLELEFRELFFRLSGELDGSPEGKMVTPEQERAWWKHLVKKLFDCHGGVPDFDRFFDELHSYFAHPDIWVMYPEVPAALEGLISAGIRLAIVSNWDNRLPRLVERFGLDRKMGAVVVSAIEGVSKPDEGIFRVALERMSAAPEEVVHVGDSLRDDVWGARRAGMRAVWLRRGGLEGKRPGDDELEAGLATEVDQAPDLVVAAGIILGA